jgi:dipeptidyl aminopeptidase/acylaminoacyl peptidase
MPRSTLGSHTTSGAAVTSSAAPRLGQRGADITPAMIAQMRTLAEPRWSSDGRTVFYLETHDGQGALFGVPVAGGPAMRLTSDPPSARAASYAGGFYTVGNETIIYQGADGALYQMPGSGGRGVRLTTGGYAVSAPTLSPDGTQIAFVADDGTTADVGILALDGASWPRKHSAPADFVADPVWSPDGSHLAWVEWSVPNMAWDESRVVICDVRTGERQVVMHEPEVSATLPQWSPDGKTFTFMCDKTGYMNLWRANRDGTDVRPWVVEPFDQAEPTWTSGQSSFAWAPSGTAIAYLRSDSARRQPRLFDVASGETRPLGDPRVSYSGVRWAPRGERLLALRQSPTQPPAVVVLDVATGDEHELATAALGGLAGSELVEPESISWLAGDGLTIHGLLFRPAGLAADERPPLLISVHGGPTGQSLAIWKPDIQYFVQHGWAVLAPNARGSSGYGRAYIQALRNEWGGADMADVVAGIDHVAGQGWADPSRVVIWGGSAGGYSALLLPALYPDHFKAAVSLFGVSDLFSLARTTHRLEAHYLDRIVGPLPEAAARYRERSPIHRASSFGAPVLMLQGDKDVAVTPDQAEAMAQAFRSAGKTCIMHIYEGEGHGWARAATTRDYIERMDRFLEEHVLLR